MELIEAEPAVRVGRVAAVLGGRLEVEEAKLARGVGVALFRPSATEGLGREVGDFTPSGEATEVRVGPVPVVGEVGFAAPAGLVAGAVPTGLAAGAREALRAAGVAAEGRYAGQSFVDCEPELRSEWSSEKNRAPWDAVRDAVWAGFDRARDRR